MKILKHNLLIIIAGVILLSSCSSKFTNYSSRYTLNIPSGWEKIDKSSEDIPDFLSSFINSSSVDVLLSKNNSSYIYVLSYTSFVNIKALYTDENSVIQLYNEIEKRFGNCLFLNKQQKSYGKISTASFIYKFTVNNTDFLYQITFLSGSISSTQAIYGISKIEDQSGIENAINSIVNSYRKF